MVVIDNRNHRQLEARHVPKRMRTEEEGSVAHHADDLLVRSGELDAGRGADAGAEMRTIIIKQLAAADRVEPE